jgi:hypothetical protein
MAFEEGSASMMDSNTSDKGAHLWLIQKLKIRQILTDFECLYYKLPWRYDVYVAFGEGGATMMDSNTYFKAKHWHILTENYSNVIARLCCYVFATL